jgi:hypothetical protein
MGKKSTKQTITIQCDSPEVHAALVGFFHQTAGEFNGQLKSILTKMGVENDPTFVVLPNGDIKASKRSYDKGQVIVSTDKGIAVKAYKELEKKTIYVVPNQSQFGVFVKTGSGVDNYLGAFPTWNSLVTDLATVKVPEEAKKEVAEKKEAVA